MRKKPCLEKLTERNFVVRYFNAAWEEQSSLVRKCSASDAMIELALWLKSRGTDDDVNVLVLTVYRGLPFITIEEIQDNG